MGVLCVDLEALTTARAREFWICWSQLTVWKIMIERITVVKFRMDDRGSSSAGCFEVKVWADTVKFTNVIVARFRKCSDLVRKGKVMYFFYIRFWYLRCFGCP